MTSLTRVFSCLRWSEVSRRIELWASIQELNEQGEYTSVELQPAKDISTGGVFQLRQVREKPRHCSAQTCQPTLTAGNEMLFLRAGSLQEATGVCEASPELGHSASAGGGCAVCFYWLCVCSLHQTTEAPRQLPGL